MRKARNSPLNGVFFLKVKPTFFLLTTGIVFIMDTAEKISRIEKIKNKFVFFLISSINCTMMKPITQ